MAAPKRSRTPSPSRIAGGARTRDWGTIRALIVIDNEPLQSAAWADFHTVRKRLEKATRDLHRHEEVDRPAYDAWIYNTFPTYITRLRELQAQVNSKGQKVQTVQAMSELTGRSAKKLWKEQLAREEHPERFKDEDEEEADQTEDEENNSRKSARGSRREIADEWDSPEPPIPTPREAKDIYRRLVQQLHPDRGGEWTAARERVWHEVQRAWADRDTDWLARLEIEWETAHEVLTPASPVSRLRRAIEELVRARRDVEKKLREYRRSFPWRFTVSEKNRDTLYRRLAENFENDLEFLQRQLDYLDATIAAWEGNGPAGRARGMSRSRQLSELDEDLDDFF